MTLHEAQQILAWHRTGQSPGSIAMFCALVNYRSATEAAAKGASIEEQGNALIAQATQVLESHEQHNQETAP